MYKFCARARLSSFYCQSSKRHAANWSRHAGFFNHTPVPRISIRRAAFWVVPAGAGIAFYLAPRHYSEGSVLPELISSPAVIPVHSHTILSPSEPDLTLTGKLLSALNNHVWEPIRTGARFLHLFIIFIPVILCSPMLLVGRQEKRLKGQRWGAIWWYDLMVGQMQAAGPTFIKLSQWAASRADLFPAALCQRLGKLHSRGRPHEFSHTKRVIEHVFQRPFDDVFEEFEETPIGTGAIAQVYRATLKHDLLPPSYLGLRRASTQTPASTVIRQDPPPTAPTAAVALKILHPHVRRTIQRDLSIMSFFAHCISLLPGMKWLSLPDEVIVFGEMMRQQVDLRHEGENLARFEDNFASRNVPVTFPRPLREWSTPDLLIEEFQNALPLELFLRNGGGPYDEQVATIGLDAFLNMLLLDNFIHSDLHPGNIMVKFSKPVSTGYVLKALAHSLYSSLFRPTVPDANHSPLPDYSESDNIVSSLRQLANDPVEWRSKLQSLSVAGYIPEVVFIDAGLVTTLSDTNRRNFLDLFSSIAEFDGYRAGHLMISRSRTPELAIDEETFALKMQHLVLSVKRKTFSLGQIKINNILTDVLKMVREHHVRMEGDFVNTVISVLLLEGIGRQLDPNMDLFKSSLPILRKVGRQVAVSESMDPSDMSLSHLGALLKVWVWLEAREFISNSIVNADDMIRYDWFTPSL